MSNIIIHDVTQQARARYVRKAQIEALPPQPPRYDRNPHCCYRMPFMHGREWLHAGLAVGRGAPELRAVKTLARQAGAPEEEIEQLTMDDLVIEPGWVGATVGGYEIRYTYGEPLEWREEEEELPPPEKREVVDTGALTLNLYAHRRFGQLSWASATLKGPAKLGTICWGGIVMISEQEYMEITARGTPWIVSFGASAAGGLQFLPAQWRLDMTIGAGHEVQLTAKATILEYDSVVAGTLTLNYERYA